MSLAEQLRTEFLQIQHGMCGLQKKTTPFHKEFWTLEDMQGHF